MATNSPFGKSSCYLSTLGKMILAPLKSIPAGFCKVLKESSVFLVSIIFRIQTRKCMKLFMENIKQILHATVLDIKVYYYPRNAILATRPQAEWNIAIPRVVINLISNTVKVQYLFYYIHYTCIQNRVRSMKTETKHSSKTTLRYQRRNATVTVHTWLAPTCVPERRHC